MMNLKEFKEILKNLDQVEFLLPNGKMVPKHFHITEVGIVTNHFIDCGGTVRKESKVNFQLWENVDFYHRLAPKKVLGIIEKANKVLDINESFEIQVEYQQETVSLYHLEFENDTFRLKNTITDCLATDVCGVEAIEKTKKKLSDLGKKAQSCCSPESGCC